MQEVIKSGNTSIDPIAVKDMSKQELYELLKGKLSDDFDLIWIKVCKANGNYESIGKPSKQGKKP